MSFLLLPFLFADKLLDVSELAEDIGKKQGGWYDAAREAAVVNGKWKAIPFSNIGQLMNWRTDWFAEVGVKKFPETWEEFYEVGKKLKAKDHPYGLELGHGFGDNHGWLYPLLWSYGGAEVQPDGKTVSIDSGETAGPSIMPASSSRIACSRIASAGPMSATTRPGWPSRSRAPTMPKASVASQARLSGNRQGHRPGDEPAGPKGRFHIMSSITHAIFDFSPQKEEAQKFLRWLMDEKQLGAWYASADTYYQPLLHGYDNAPMWQVEPRNIPIATRSPMPTSWAGPRRPAVSWPRASPNTSSSTCSPRPAPAPRPRR